MDEPVAREPADEPTVRPEPRVRRAPAAQELDRFWEDLASCGDDTDRLLRVITERVAAVVGEAAVLTVVAADGVTLEPVAFAHPDADVRAAMEAVLSSSPYRVGEGAIGTAAADREPVVLSDIDQAALAPLLAEGTLPFLERYPIRSMMLVPLIAFGELMGTLGVMRVHSREPYASADLDVLLALAERAALAIANAKRTPRTLELGDYEAIYHNSLDGVLFTMPDGRILAANPAACAILARSESEICRIGRAGVIVEDDPRVKRGVARRSLSGSVRTEVPMRRGDGRIFIAELASTMFTAEDGDPRACVIFRDVSEQVAIRERLERQTQELEHLIDQDPLSGLLNRRGFRSAAEQALRFADRELVPVQVAYIDLDDLKLINDRHGHARGDAVLARLGAAIGEGVRSVDVAARLSGDEFAVLLYRATGDDALAVLERVSLTFAQKDDTVPETTFSVGLAERLPGSSLALDDLLDAADRAMYQRKTLRRIERNRSRRG